MKNQKEICLLLTYVLDMYDQNTLPIPLAISFERLVIYQAKLKSTLGSPYRSTFILIESHNLIQFI